MKVTIRKKQEPGPSSLSPTPSVQHATEGPSLRSSLGCDTSQSIMTSDGLNHRPGTPWTQALERPQLKRDAFSFRTRALARSERSWKPSRDGARRSPNLEPDPHSQPNTPSPEARPVLSTLCLAPTQRPKAYGGLHCPLSTTPHPPALSGA